MQVSSSVNIFTPQEKSVAIKPLYTEKISSDEAKEIREQIKQNANAVAFNSVAIQDAVSAQGDFAQEYADYKDFLKDIGYSGKPIAKLSKSEAAELVSEDGFFGVDKTSQRVAEFVINGAGGDESKLRAGREGMIRGFKEAEAMWGGELPEISQKTMQKAIEMVDKTMQDLGFSIIDKEV